MRIWGKIRLDSVQRWLTLGSLLISASGCNEILSIHLQTSRVPKAAVTTGWTGPHEVDMGDSLDAASASFYSTTNGAVVSGTAQSFADFRALPAPDGLSVQLVATLYDGSRFRPVARRYTVSSGWGSVSGYLDGALSGSYSQIAVGSGANALQAVFTPLSGLIADQASATYFGESATWGATDQLISPSLLAIPAGHTPNPQHLVNGRNSALAWDASGSAYLAFVELIGLRQLIVRFNAFVGWDTAFGAAGPNLQITYTPPLLPVITASSQTEVISDGIGATQLSILDGYLTSSWSVDGYFSTSRAISNSTAKSFAAASDGQGTVLTVYLQNDASLAVNPITTTPFIRNNSVRVYASVRGGDGNWVGPTRLDDSLNAATTTAYQNANLTAAVLPAAPFPEPTGGIDYFTPGVAYVGGGRFIAAFAMTDLAYLTSSIYVRGYQVGVGWDAAPVVLDSQSFSSSTAETFRYGSDFAMSANGAGDAMLVAHVAINASSSSTSVIQRSHALKAFPYRAGTWGTARILDDSACAAIPTAPAVLTSYYCWISKPSVATLPSGDSVIVYASPTSSSTAASPQLRLKAMEYHP